MLKEIEQARTPVQERDALLTQAAFYLMWHSGLRLGEVEALAVEDVDLGGRSLIVRDGKGRADRTVYLTERSVTALQAYLQRRGMGGSDHMFLYCHRAVRKDLLQARLKAAGQRVGVTLSPHRLRHTYATQLLNAGCPVTSIQKLMGHRNLNTTMIYARVHNRTVADDYYAAMKWIEQGLNLAGSASPHQPDPISQVDRGRILDFVNHLAAPNLDQERRLDLVRRMRDLLGQESPPACPAETEPEIHAFAINSPAEFLDTVAQGA